ncbi:MAG: DUF1016 N-terminal domain-containing protein, partial [Candidatus Altiarchaeota archaeon]|nr:DUF1016 N-terminal domain-containing protein [Candidatus Altiarchaeota archaeon]
MKQPSTGFQHSISKTNTLKDDTRFTLWQTGKIIVEEEQRGEKRAEYGEYIISELSLRLTHEFGKEFNRTNLKYIRQFHLKFPKVNALRAELTWTHYRLLLRVDKEQARQFYPVECVNNNWSTHTPAEI